MVRLGPSADVCEFVTLFVDAVTAHSESRYDWVARSGKHSVFTLLSRIASQVMPSSMMVTRFIQPCHVLTPSSGSQIEYA
jgi:3-deoxy-D-arabino-heptulosonate 7-phosphate (DAHP) synthase class II